MTLKAIIEEASKLSPAERDELIDELIRMVDPNDVALTPQQSADLGRRVDEYEAGKADVVDGAQYIGRLQDRRKGT